jgi:hypothetical protein
MSRSRSWRRPSSSARRIGLVAEAPPAIGNRTALVFAFVASGCVLILEIVAGRMLAPELGFSLYMWTSVIGVVLGGVLRSGTSSADGSPTAGPIGRRSR